MAAGTSDGRPSYKQLLGRQDAPPGSTWGLFGPDDDRGTINLIGSEQVLGAAACVRRGAVFNLDRPLDAFDPPLVSHRHTIRHRIFQVNDNHRDDQLDDFYPQASSQIDGLRHMRHPHHGFYNDAPDDEIDVGTPRLGIQRWAETGIVGRGVLLDVDRYCREQGRLLDHGQGVAIDVSVLEDTARDQDVEVQPGDIVLLRTGWARHYLDLDEDGRAAERESKRFTGLVQSHDTLAWMWDHRIAAIGSDTVGVEALPPVATSPFWRTGDSTIHAGLMHHAMIALLGLALGELWDLDALADDCERDGAHTSMVIAKPLYMTGGVGSPANAVAIK